MGIYWVKVAKVYEDYIEADSEAEALDIAQETMREGIYGYWDNEVEKCKDEEDE